MFEEVKECDGILVLVEVLGFCYVVFCDIEGWVGLLDEFCFYCFVFLVFGCNEDCGICCLYYGWKFDVEGNVVVMVLELLEVEKFMCLKVKYKVYKIVEWGGFFWVWLGEGDVLEFKKLVFVFNEDV